MEQQSVFLFFVLLCNCVLSLEELMLCFLLSGALVSSEVVRCQPDVDGRFGQGGEVYAGGL